MKFICELEMEKMKYAISTLILGLTLSGCAVGSGFKPTTVEGANCKAQCARNMAICQGSSYTCDRAASTCMSACEELDLIKSKNPN
jgi:hypothetical protein